METLFITLLVTTTIAVTSFFGSNALDPSLLKEKEDLDFIGEVFTLITLAIYIMLFIMLAIRVINYMQSILGAL
jgi:heme/copper-type cytochrome/quinol oxidase subunit 2